MGLKMKKLACDEPRVRLRSDVTRDMLEKLKNLSAAHIDRLLRGEHLVVQSTGMHETIFCLSFVETTTYVDGGLGDVTLTVNFIEPVCRDLRSTKWGSGSSCTAAILNRWDHRS
jgi:hypothetical protein